MKSYKDFAKESIGSSDIGALVLVVAAFKGWLRIYDDDGKTFEKSAAEINVYRSGDFGCIIQTL